MLINPTTSILSLDDWICPVQYAITMEDSTEDEGAQAENNAAEEDNQTSEGVEASASAEDSAKPDKKPWFMERIDKLTAQKNEHEQRATTLATQNQQLKQYVEMLLSSGATPAQTAAAASAVAEGMSDAGNAGAGRAAPGAPQGRLYNQAEIDALIEAKVNERVQQVQASAADVEFNQRCNSVAQQGAAKFPDTFNAGVQALNAAGVMDRGFLDAVTSLDDAPSVLNFLGKDPAEAMRIKNLSPVRMAVELTKIETKLAVGTAPTVRPASNAPAPVTQVGGKAVAAPSTLEATDDVDAWIALREKQLAERQGRTH